MIVSGRKMKRTKREQAMLAENMNRDAIGHLMQQYQVLAEGFVIMQKNLFALMNILKRQRIIDDFVMHQELTAIDEMEVMNRKAFIIKDK